MKNMLSEAAERQGNGVNLRTACPSVSEQGSRDTPPGPEGEPMSSGQRTVAPYHLQITGFPLHKGKMGRSESQLHCNVGTGG